MKTFFESLRVDLLTRTLHNLVKAVGAHPRHLVVLVLQGRPTLRAAPANGLAASSAVVAAFEEGEIAVAVLALGHPLVRHPKRRPVPDEGALRGGGQPPPSCEMTAVNPVGIQGRHCCLRRRRVREALYKNTRFEALS